MDGVVLGVDGQEGDVVLAGGGEDEFAGGDHALLVGEADGLAGENGGVGGFEAGDADDGGDDEVGFGMGGDATVPAVPWTTSMPVTPAALRRAASWSASSSVASETTRGRQRRPCAKASSTLRPAASEMALVAVGERLDDGEGALADGAGGTEDGELLHSAIFADSKMEARERSHFL